MKELIVLIILISIAGKAQSQVSQNWFSSDNEIRNIYDVGDFLYVVTSYSNDNSGIYEFDKSSKLSKLISEIYCPDGEALNFKVGNHLMFDHKRKTLWVTVHSDRLTENTGIMELDGNNVKLHTVESAGFPEYGVHKLTMYIEKMFLKRNGDLVVIFAGSTKGNIRHFGIYDGNSWKIDSLDNISHSFVGPNSSDLRFGGMIEASQGNIWISYYEEDVGSGFLNYNGLRWKLFINPNSRSQDHIFYYGKLDSNDIIWIKAENGFLQFDGEIWDQLKFSDYDLPFDNISRWSFDKNGDLLASYSVYNQEDSSYYFRGICKFDGEQWDIFPVDDEKLNAKSVSGFQIDRSGDLWLALQSFHPTGPPQNYYQPGYYEGHGLIRFDGTGMSKFDSTNTNITNNLASGFFFDRDSNLVFTTRNELVTIQDGEFIIRNIIEQDDRWNNYKFHGLKHDGESFWSYDYPFVIEINGGDVRRYKLCNSELPTNKVSDIEIDKDGNVWIASDSGLVMYNGTDFKRFDKIDSPLASDKIYDIAIDSTNSVWIAGANAVYKLKDNNWVVHHSSIFPKIIQDSTTRCVSIDSRNHVWVYTSNSEFIGYKNYYYDDIKNITVYDGIGFQTFDEEFEPMGFVRSLCHDPYGNTWCALVDSVRIEQNNWQIIYYKFTGFAKYDGNSWNKIDQVELPDTSLAKMKFISDRTGDLWGYSEDKVALYDGVSIKLIDSTTFEHNPINNLHFDNNNQLWISSDYGLVKYVSDKEYETFNSCNTDLPSNIVTASRVDSEGNIWLIDHGLTVSLPDETSSAGSIAEEQVHIYTHPNPFTQSLITNYELQEPGYISLRLYDLLGNEVAELVNGFKEAGSHEARFDGSALPKGMYLLKMHAGGKVITNKIIHY